MSRVWRCLLRQLCSERCDRGATILRHTTMSSCMHCCLAICAWYVACTLHMGCRQPASETHKLDLSHACFFLLPNGMTDKRPTHRQAEERTSLWCATLAVQLAPACSRVGSAALRHIRSAASRQAECPSQPCDCICLCSTKTSLVLCICDMLSGPQCRSVRGQCCEATRSNEAGSPSAS